MEEGALGIGSSLIYAPAFYADTHELIELCKVAAEYDGMYISHMRSEGNQLVEAVEELIKIAREANVPAEIYHLKAAGKENWPKRDRVDRIGRAGPGRRPADHGRHVSVYGRLDGAERRDAPLGAGRRPAALDRADARSGDPQASGRRNAHADRRVGKPAAGGRLAGKRAAGRLQEPGAQASDGQERWPRWRPAAAHRRKRPRWTW